MLKVLLTMIVKILPRADWLVIIVYKVLDNKNEVSYDAFTSSTENKANAALTFSFSFYYKTKQRQFPMVYTLVDHKMFKTWQWNHSPAPRGSTWVLNDAILWPIRASTIENCRGFVK